MGRGDGDDAMGFADKCEGYIGLYVVWFGSQAYDYTKYTYLINLSSILVV